LVRKQNQYVDLISPSVSVSSIFSPFFPFRVHSRFPPFTGLNEIVHSIFLFSSGKILEDTQPLKDLGLEYEKKSIVIMVTKAKAAQPAASAAAAPAAAEAKKGETMDTSAAPAAQPPAAATPAAAPASAEPAAVSGIAASTLLSGQELEDVVKNIMEMGNNRDQVRASTHHTSCLMHDLLFKTYDRTTCVFVRYVLSSYGVVEVASFNVHNIF
jgi:hypothetical protein